MSTLGVVCVITGSWESGWYCTWGVSGINVITIVVFGLIDLTEVDNLQGVPPTGGEGETMVTP